MTASALLGLFAIVAFAAAALAGSPERANATPTGVISNWVHTAVTTSATYDLTLTNDATPVAGAAFTFPTPRTTVQSTTPAGACGAVPASSPLTCSIPANGVLVIRFRTEVGAICTPQNITLGPWTIGGTTIPRTLSPTIPAFVDCAPFGNLAYAPTTSGYTWQVSLPATVGNNVTLTFISAEVYPGCPFIYYASTFQGQPTNPQCAVLGGIPALGAAPLLNYQIVATSLPGICGALPRNGPVTSLGTVDCTIPANSPASTVSLSAVVPARQCSEYLISIPGFILNPDPTFGGFLGYPGVFAHVPADFSLCPAVVIPPVTQPAAPTATSVPGAPTATPTQVALAPLVPIVPQVFQNPALGGIFNGPRNSATPRPAVAVAPAAAAGPSAMPVLRPPSTGDAGLVPIESYATDTAAEQARRGS